MEVVDNQGTSMKVPDYVERVVTLGENTVDIVESAGGDYYIVASDGSSYASSVKINGRVEQTVDSIKSYDPQVVVASDTSATEPCGFIAFSRHSCSLYIQKRQLRWHHKDSAIDGEAIP